MPAPSILERLGLHRPELRAWAMYDWANSAFMVTIVTAVLFLSIFSSVAARRPGPGDGQLPVRGHDDGRAGLRRGAGAGAGGGGGLRGHQEEDAGGLRGAGRGRDRVHVSSSSAGTGCWRHCCSPSPTSGSRRASCSPTPCCRTSPRPDEMDRVSTAGYALGYLGGGLLLLVNLAWIQRPELFGLSGAELASRLSFLSVAVWWAGFLDSPVPEGARAGPDPRGGRAGGGERHSGVSRPAEGDVARAARVPAGVRDAACVPHLQRRHRHHHPDGDHLRDRDRPRAGRPDRRGGAGPVRRGAVRLRVSDSWPRASGRSAPSSCRWRCTRSSAGSPTA